MVVQWRRTGLVTRSGPLLSSACVLASIATIMTQICTKLDLSDLRDLVRPGLSGWSLITGSMEVLSPRDAAQDRRTGERGEGKERGAES